MSEPYFWNGRTEAYNFEDIANSASPTALGEGSDAPSLDINLDDPERGFIPGNLSDGERGHMPGNVDGADSSDSLIVLTTDYDALFI